VFQIELARLNLMNAPFDFKLASRVPYHDENSRGAFAFTVGKFISDGAAVGADRNTIRARVYLFIIDLCLLHNCIHIPHTDNKTVG